MRKILTRIIDCVISAWFVLTVSTDIGVVVAAYCTRSWNPVATVKAILIAMIGVAAVLNYFTREV